MIKEKEKSFKLDNFEGPLDLLLHLIREKKMDILEISLVVVADQYIKYIEEAKKVNLDIASEYWKNFPAGVTAPIIKVSALEKSLQNYRNNDDLEHVTNYIFENLRKFKILYFLA